MIIKNAKTELCNSEILLNMCNILLVFLKISELCNSEVLFSLNALPTPYRPSKTFCWIKLGSTIKNIHLGDFKNLFSNMDINFAYFANFNFVHLY